MKKINYKIVEAEKSDAPFIARGIMMALHIGEKDSAIDMRDDEISIWEKIFTELAGRIDTQYSYKNTLKAIDDEGHILGIIVSYDGAQLHCLREPFFTTVREYTGKDFSNIPDETTPDEWYLDSLSVGRPYRRQGIGSALLLKACQRAFSCGKPAGLLVDKFNTTARKAYERLGFRYIGERPFTNIMMDHLRKENL